MNNKFERRKDKRYIIGFPLEVSAQDLAGKKYREKTVLKNICIEGAQFVTKLSDKYYPGQQLKITLYLPGTDEVNARMTGKATVIRIDRPDKSQINHEDKEIAITIKIDSPFYFKKINIKPG
ncbi:MAG: PilZ domain-containing protein [Desulfobacteraceae bacterium]|nr:PilZ domain-containing protein [Desulfobacteraceae bacterium]